MAKTLVTILGVLFIVLGLLGFVNNPVLGFFEVDAMHNVVHIVSGVLALIFASKGSSSARMFAKVFGLIYAVIGIAGLITVPDGGVVFGFLNTNFADHVLHLVLGIIFIVVGFSKDKGQM
jgi:hypothetical protein